MQILTVDIGGTFIKYACMQEDMSVLAKGKIPTPQEGREELIEAIGQIYDQMPQVDGISISIPGIIDPEKGYCAMGGALQYNNDFYMRERLYQRCPVKICMENDANCAAMAEAAVGSLKDVEDGFVLILGTMIGGGLIRNHRLLRGKHFSAGEVSYINTMRDEMPHYENVWGNRGGTSGLCRMYAARKDMKPEQVNGIMVFDAVHAGERDAIECLDLFTREIAIQLFNIQTILDLERFAIGGGISAQPILIEKIRDQLDTLYGECPYRVPRAEVVACTFRNDANLIGALQCFLAS